MTKKIPEWIKIKDYDKKEYLETLNIIENSNLNTVCVQGNCPNRYECFSKKTATFMILGNVCTRNCKYCNIKKGFPEKVDDTEPLKIAKAIHKLKLNYAVITCVTRDDLGDAGVGQFIRTIQEIKKLNHNCKVEVLISDLKGNYEELEKLVNAKPDVINHNIEIVRDLFAELRPKGDYGRSLQLLRKIKEFVPEMKIKSGLMVGFGETEKQIQNTLRDLKKVDCDIITIGQYLQPKKENFEVVKYYSLKEFEDMKKYGEEIGLRKIFAGPLVRSSYKASECV
jgi:lipoyl synthase